MKRSLIFPFILMAFLVAKPSFAGFLRITGDPIFEVRVEDGGFLISGSIELRNEGDERARDVFPALRVGKWKWSGKPREMNPKSSYRWEFEGRIAFKDLKCTKETPCEGVSLPMTGAFPAFLLRRYKDLNGYEFSAPGVFHIFFTDNVLMNRSPKKPKFQLNARLSLKSLSGGAFEGELIVKNKGASGKKVFLGFHSSREVQVTTPPGVFEIDGHAEKRLVVEGKNLSGLQGSRYLIYSVLGWGEAGQREFSAVSSMIQIKKSKKMNLFLPLFLGAMVLSVLVIIGIFGSARKENS